MNEIISPNWHAILIHYPLALLSLGIVIELFSFLWRRSRVRDAARWMIFLGALACVPAVTTGIYAYRDALGQTPYMTWHQLQTNNDFHNPAQQFAFMRSHMLWNSVGTGVLVIVVVTYLGLSDRWRRKLYVLLFILLICGEGMLTRGAWNGGEAVYRYGTAVKGPEPRQIGNPNLSPDELATTGMDPLARRYLEPMQLHVLMAGVLVSLALAGLGLSIRGITSAAGKEEEESWFENREISDGRSGDHIMPAAAHNPASAAAKTGPEIESSAGVAIVAPVFLPVRAARWWVLAFVAALVTAAGGLWAANWLSWSTDIAPMFTSRQTALSRNGVHLILGIGIIVLLLVLALVARFGRRSKSMLAIFAFLLTLFIASQIWIGVLLMFDTGAGPLTGFEKSAEAPSTKVQAVPPAGIAATLPIVHRPEPASVPVVARPEIPPAPITVGPAVPLEPPPMTAHLPAPIVPAPAVPAPTMPAPTKPVVVPTKPAPSTVRAVGSTLPTTHH